MYERPSSCSLRAVDRLSGALYPGWLHVLIVMAILVAAVAALALMRTADAVTSSRGLCSTA